MASAHSHDVGMCCYEHRGTRKSKQIGDTVWGNEYLIANACVFL